MTELYADRDTKKLAPYYQRHDEALRFLSSERGPHLYPSARRFVAAELAKRDQDKAFLKGEIERHKREAAKYKNLLADEECNHSSTLEERDHWHDKALELAEDVAKLHGLSIGEHSNMNCPVQNAIDSIDALKQLSEGE